VTRFPESEHVFEEKTEQIDVQIKYIPTQEFSWRSYRPYTHVTSLTRNLLSHVLKQKVQQFKESGYHGYKIIGSCVTIVQHVVVLRYD
jgi:hypothetical protein